jgi:hypothetical protein
MGRFHIQPLFFDNASDASSALGCKVLFWPATTFRKVSPLPSQETRLNFTPAIRNIPDAAEKIPV